MTIDRFLISPLSHYVVGSIGKATVAHSEIKFKGKSSPELAAQIQTARDDCLLNCEDILSNPAKYTKLPDYQLLPQDQDFLQKVLEKARQIDWNNPQKVKDLGYFVDSQCR